MKIWRQKKLQTCIKKKKKIIAWTTNWIYCLSLHFIYIHQKVKLYRFKLAPFPQNHETIIFNSNTQAIHISPFFSSETSHHFSSISHQKRPNPSESKCYVFLRFFFCSASVICCLAPPFRNIDGGALFGKSTVGLSWPVLFVSTFSTPPRNTDEEAGQSEIYATAYFTFKSSCFCSKPLTRTLFGRIKFCYTW